VALIDDAQGIAVTGAPGTGSTSLLTALQEQAGLRPCPADDVLDADGHQVLDAKHATVAELVAAGLVPADHGWTIVTSTRNPFDFYVAEWERSRTRWIRDATDPTSWVNRQPGALERIIDAVVQPFETWVVGVLADDRRDGVTRHLNAGHVGEADVVVRLEHLADDLVVAGFGDLEVPHLNRTPRTRPYWQYYDVDAREAVAAVHAPDLERFGYRF
jgi:hypothetical protein